MPGLKIIVRGYKRVQVDSNWETHIVDSTLDGVFSGNLDGFNIVNWRLNSFDASMVFRKSGIDMTNGDNFTINDINNGIITMEYFHGVASSGNSNFTLTGGAEYEVNFRVNSIF